MTLTTTMPEEARTAALLKAIGFDRLSAEQRELALGIANRYGLDPMLKHIVLIDGKPYITRDGLLHVAHKDGQLDGIVTTEPVLGEDTYWRSTCSVYRKDMSYPFTYTGRYPSVGERINKKFAPEMAVKVGEVMALRRAFDVAAPVIEERWDVPADAAADVQVPPQPASLADRVAQRAQAVTHPDGTEVFTGKADQVAAREELVERSPTQMYEGMPLSPEPQPEPRERPEPPATPASGTDTQPADTAMTLQEFTDIVSAYDRARVKAVTKSLYPDVKRYADLAPDQMEAIVEKLVADTNDEPAYRAIAGAVTEVVGPIPASEGGTCGEPSPYSESTCTLEAGHPGKIHQAGLKESWEMRTSE